MKIVGIGNCPGMAEGGPGRGAQDHTDLRRVVFAEVEGMIRENLPKHPKVEEESGCG